MPTRIKTPARFLPGRSFAQAPVQPQGLADLVPDGQNRIEGGHGLLKNHGDPITPDRPHLRPFELHQISAGKQKLPGLLTHVFGQQPQNDSAVTVLPQPDSPTSPRVSPAFRLKVMPFTAGTTPMGV